jgi:hypothetical protein
MECIGCSQHANSQPFPLRGSNCRGGRQLIWATDQSMPPMLPTSSTQECVKIMRLESGSLQELAEGLVRTLSGCQVAAGSVVALTSASNMTAVGTAAYAEDLVEAIKFLRSNLGDHLLYGPLPNLLLNGCDDPINNYRGERVGGGGGGGSNGGRGGRGAAAAARGGRRGGH